LHDNVVCQHRLITEHLGIDRILLVVGYSMGAQQAYQWGALYSDMVRAIAPLCGSARTSPHNHLFLEGGKAALLADGAFADGWY
jgi:homoserine O-acetyltransferase